MANEQITTAATQTDQRNSTAVANNIAKNIQDKANGKDSGNKDTGITGKETAVDPNAGKEKYVVDKKEIWLTPEQARAYVQKGIAFEPKVDQLNHLQRETAAFLNELKNNPEKILFDKRIGHTPESVFDKIMSSSQISDSIKEKVGKWYYENAVVPAKMTPEQREAMEAKRKLTEYETREASARDQAVKLENQRRVDAALNQLKANISEAMKESGLPSNDTPLGAFMARRVADVMRLGYIQRKAITPKEAIQTVKSELKQFQTAWYDNLDEENLVKELGEKNAEKVKKYFLKLVKEAEKQPQVSRVSATPRGERKTINSDDFRDYLDKLKRGEK